MIDLRSAMNVHSFQFLDVWEAVPEARQPLHIVMDLVLDAAEVDVEVGGHISHPLALDLPQVVDEAHLGGCEPLAGLILGLPVRGVGHQALAPQLVVIFQSFLA